MVKLKLVFVFVAAAIVAGSLTLAPRAYAYWKMVHPITCVPSVYGFGFHGVDDGELGVDYLGIQNTSSHTKYLLCPDWQDSNSFTSGYVPLVRLKFYRGSTAAQVPKVQFCNRWSCSYYFYGDANTVGDVFMDVYGHGWRAGEMNVIFVPLEPMNQDWNRYFSFRGITIGDEYGPLL